MSNVKQTASRTKQSGVNVQEPDHLCLSCVGHRLPLYGPLEINNAKEYFSESKTRFFENYYKICTKSVTTNDFNILYTIAKGTFGTVRLVQNKYSEGYFAVKIMEKRRLVEIGNIGHVLNEKRVLQSIDFPFSIRMECFIKDSTNLYFVMPFITGGDLFTHLRAAHKFSEQLSCFYAAQIVLALDYLQYLRFVYRDLKPENILIDHLGFVKLVDYGFAKLVESRTYTFCGTPQYLAPEVIQGVGYARSVDWWSLGVFVYEMVAGNPPFEAKDNTKLFTKIMYDPITMPKHFSASLQSLVKKLLQRDVTRRFGNLKDGAEDVKNHEWFKKVDWLQLLNRRTTPPFVPDHGAGYADVSNFPDLERCSELKISEHDEYVDQFKDF